MIKRPRYVINGNAFTSQDAIKNHYRKILDWTAIGCAVTDEEFSDCIELFKRHPEWQQKEGVGIASIEVRSNPEWGGPCFWLVRKDGSDTDISYRTCIRAKKPTAREDFAKAARHAISDQVIRFKREAFGERMLIRCELSGAIVSKDDAEVDHVIPFRDLLAWFSERKSIDINEVEYMESADGDCTKEFKCELLTSEWQEFHLKHAKLRMLSSESNRLRR